MSHWKIPRIVRPSLRKRVHRLVNHVSNRLAPRDPVTVFHHIPKCGGTSFNKFLSERFEVVRDYRTGWESKHKNKVDLNHLTNRHLLSGHFECEGAYLHQRYPEVFESERYRVFTILRDPFELRVSLYRYEKKHGVCTANSLDEFLFRERNWLAKRFPVKSHEIEKTLDRYDFIGTMDDPQLTLDVLSWKFDFPGGYLPHVNATAPANQTAAAQFESGVVERFRELNPLDYLIYEESQSRFDQAVALYYKAKQPLGRRAG